MYRNGGAAGLGLIRAWRFGGNGRQGQRYGARAAAQNGRRYSLLFALEHPHPWADLVGWAALLENAGYPIIQAAVLFVTDGLFVVHTHFSQ